MTAKKSKAGRKSKYQPSFPRLAYRHCLLGATNQDLAKLFGVSDVTIDNWLKDKPRFLGAVKRGRTDADARVAKSLYRRAIGYSHKAVKIMAVAIGDNQGSRIEQVPYVERYAPDTGAAMAWLKNRQPDRWRDKREVEITDSRADRIAAARARVLNGTAQPETPARAD